VVEPDLFTRRSARRPVAARHAPERSVQPRRPGGPDESRIHERLARQLHRPARLRVPSTALRIALAETSPTARSSQSACRAAR